MAGVVMGLGRDQLLVVTDTTTQWHDPERGAQPCPAGRRAAAQAVRYRGREVEVEQLHVHLPRVLKTPAGIRTAHPRPGDHPMILRMFRRCGAAPGTPLTAEDQAVVDAFRAMLAAVRTPEPWTPGAGQDIAVQVGPFIERAHPRPGDDHGPETIAAALVHPDTPHAAAHLHGRRLGYTDRGWLRCRTTAILGAWQPAYTMLTHAAANQPLPDDVGMAPAHYAVHVEASRPDGTGYTLLRLGPYTQTLLASRDADRLNTELGGRAAITVPDCTVTATSAPFDVTDHQSYTDPYKVDAVALMTAALGG
ncbi:hypothetical protein [Streptomyces sp. NPDC058279]|uniref:hypothetical protein n=1 Tax=Streptomyces sp. NPDC058279 TaxID=3346418 RepID=UPI0036EED04D